MMRVVIPLLAVASAVVLWGLSLPGVDLSRMNDLGLISVLSPAMFVALGILTISFCVAVHQPSTLVPVLCLHIIVLILILHGTPTILYGTLRYSWAWKHVGIVDYIQRHGSVDPSISFLNAYHNWPGFFALAALITEGAGLKSALSFAAWGPPFFNLLDLGGLLLIFNAFTRDRRLVWLSIWFFYLTNWVGQDYFSPQAMSYFLSLVILGILLTCFSVTATPPLSVFKRRLVFDGVAHLFRRIVFDRSAYALSQLRSTADRANTLDGAPRPLQRIALLVIIIVLFTSIVSSHQLTPFMTLLAVAGLVVFQRCRVYNLPLLMIVITVTWFVDMAVAFLNGNLYWIVQSIGSMDANANSTLINVQTVSYGLQIVAFVGRILTASIGGIAFLGFVRRLRHGYWDLSCIILALAPGPMLAANSYGGEMLFRVYFFALPFLAFFAAAVLYPSQETGRAWRTPIVTIVVSIGLLVGFCFAYYGKERMNYFSKNEVAASQYLYNTAPSGSLLLDVDGDYPWAFEHYEIYSYQSLVFDTETANVITRRQQAALLRDPIAYISGVMGDTAHTGAYVIFTRAQEATSDENGYLPIGSLGRIESMLRHSRRFKVILSNPDATIFSLAVTGP